jgi:hypothetical protein
MAYATLEMTYFLENTGTSAKAQYRWSFILALNFLVNFADRDE